MSRKFISIVLAASIAVTALSVPQAQAGNRALNKFLAGVAVIAVIGALAESRGNRREPTYVNPTTRPLPPQVQRKILPRNCLKTVNTQGRRQNVYLLRCLKQNYDYTNELPNACTTNVSRNDGTNFLRPAYGAQCLGQYGYKVARH